jgi:hypothetical protein
MADDQHVMVFGVWRWMRTEPGPPPRRGACGLFQEADNRLINHWKCLVRIENAFARLVQIVRPKYCWRWHFVDTPVPLLAETVPRTSIIHGSHLQEEVAARKATPSTGFDKEIDKIRLSP